jgi:DNA-directed RNA polymerase subunit B
LRDLVEVYFKERSIVNHHISSFNDFLSTLDNPSSRMQKIVDNLRVSAEDIDRGIIRLDPDKTEGRIVEIRVGRRRDEKTGNIEPQARPTIQVTLPVVREANGASHSLTPMEARLRNLNYLAPVWLDFIIVEDGIEKEPEKVHIGDLPIMVKSKRCTLFKENLEEERELTEA